MILKEKEIPDKPGVYLMKNSGGRTIYVGKAANLRRRLGQYFGTQRKSFKVNILVNRIRQVDYLVTASERESLILEDILIKKYQPFYNTLLKDDKSYPYLKITGEKFPRLMLARKSKSDDGKGTYYGPYPQTPGLKNIVALLNATFQLRPCKYDLDAANRDYDNCIYLQTERCSGPCQKNVSSVQYGKNVRKLRLFLEGKYSALEKKLKEEMKRFADRMEFEKAAAARDVINSLNNMRSRIRVGRLFPADLDAVRTITDDLAMLKDALGLKKYPSVIECIDISNMGESFPVGSVVRFHLGEPDRANYRKYKIKQRGLQDDFAMISEVLERRLRRLSNESPQNLPDLIVVDGGKGQLNSAVTVLKKLQLKIDLISIAKSPRDTIYLPSGSNPITITGSDRHLFVIQRIRDEAHRFALSFHRNLRAKKHCHRDTEVTEKKQRTKNKIKISVLSVVNLFLVTLAFGGEAKYDHLINRYAMEHGLDPALSLIHI